MSKITRVYLIIVSNPNLDVVDCLLCFWSWRHQSLTCEYFPCVHDMIKAFRAETSVQSVIPHFQLCPLSAHRAMPESSICGFADGIFHQKLPQFTNVLIATGTPQRSACTRVFTVPGFAESLKLEIFSLALIRTINFRLLSLLMACSQLLQR